MVNESAHTWGVSMTDDISNGSAQVNVSFTLWKK
jgi:hypothetical protein